MAKKLAHHDRLGEHLNREGFEHACGPCHVSGEGPSFTIHGIFPETPEGFRREGAWHDIYRHVYLLMHGGSAPWIRRPGNAPRLVYGRTATRLVSG